LFENGLNRFLGPSQKYVTFSWVNLIGIVGRFGPKPGFGKRILSEPKQFSPLVWSLLKISLKKLKLHASSPLHSLIKMAVKLLFTGILQGGNGRPAPAVTGTTYWVGHSSCVEGNNKADKIFMFWFVPQSMYGLLLPASIDALWHTDIVAGLGSRISGERK